MSDKKTIFCDIDGTLVKYPNRELFEQLSPEKKLEFTDGAQEKILEWVSKDYNIILTTGRKESARKITEDQLRQLGIAYDQLIMGIGGGQRVLINDKKPNLNEPTAIAIVVDRNGGIKNINV